MAGWMKCGALAGVLLLAGCGTDGSSSGPVPPTHADKTVPSSPMTSPATSGSARPTPTVSGTTAAPRVSAYSPTTSIASSASRTSKVESTSPAVVELSLQRIGPVSLPSDLATVERALTPLLGAPVHGLRYFCGAPGSGLQHRASLFWDTLTVSATARSTVVWIAQKGAAPPSSPTYTKAQRPLRLPLGLRVGMSKVSAAAAAGPLKPIGGPPGTSLVYSVRGYQLWFDSNDGSESNMSLASVATTQNTNFSAFDECG